MGSVPSVRHQQNRACREPAYFGYQFKTNFLWAIWVLSESAELITLQTLNLWQCQLQLIYPRSILHRGSTCPGSSNKFTKESSTTSAITQSSWLVLKSPRGELFILLHLLGLHVCFLKRIRSSNSFNSSNAFFTPFWRKVSDYILLKAPEYFQLCPASSTLARMVSWVPTGTKYKAINSILMIPSRLFSRTALQSAGIIVYVQTLVSLWETSFVFGRAHREYFS